VPLPRPHRVAGRDPIRRHQLSGHDGTLPETWGTMPSRFKRKSLEDTTLALECKLLLVLPLKDLGGERTGSTLILGQAVGVHIDRAFLKDGLFDITTAHTIARCGNRGDYTEVTRVFEMLRPAL
jgi:flavin reductase (DIM6/NTAB) family NADH-FMN oxidoreductase RutF